MMLRRVSYARPLWPTHSRATANVRHPVGSGFISKLSLCQASF
jgi:hypothetical protein